MECHSVLVALIAHDVKIPKFTDKNENMQLNNWLGKISDFNIYMDFLEGVQDFMVVGDPLIYTLHACMVNLTLP